MLVVAAGGCGGENDGAYTAEAVRACLADAGMHVRLEERESEVSRDLQVQLADNFVSVRVYDDERKAEEREQDRLFYAEDEQEELFGRRANVVLEWDDAPTPAEADAVYGCLGD